MVANVVYVGLILPLFMSNASCIPTFDDIKLVHRRTSVGRPGLATFFFNKKHQKVNLGYVLTVQCPCSYLGKTESKPVDSVVSSHSPIFACQEGMLTFQATKFLMFFFLFRQDRRLEMLLFSIENPGWCPSAQCSSAYDFIVHFETINFVTFLMLRIQCSCARPL